MCVRSSVLDMETMICVVVVGDWLDIRVETAMVGTSVEVSRTGTVCKGAVTVSVG